MSIISGIKTLFKINSSPYGKQIGKTALNGNRVFCKIKDGRKTLTTLDSNNKIIRKGHISPESIYSERVIEEGILKNGERYEKQKVTNLRRFKEDGLLGIREEKYISTTKFYASGGSFTGNYEFLSTRAFVKYEGRNTASMHIDCTKGYKDTSVEKGEYLTTGRGGSGWWQWRINNKPVESYEFREKVPESFYNLTEN